MVKYRAERSTLRSRPSQGDAEVPLNAAYIILKARKGLNNESNAYQGRL